MTILLAGFLLGLAGSAHCAGMCGPLVLTIRRGFSSPCAPWRAMVAYHGGRVLIYLLLGAAAGLAGVAVSSGGLGRALSIGSGLLVIAMALRWRIAPTRAGKNWTIALARVSAAANRSTQTNPIAAQVLAGAANGLLPCGLVYGAAIAAAGLGNTVRAVAFMTGFGLATLPVLVGVSLSAASLPLSLRVRLRRVAPAALVLTGLLLIARGLMPLNHVAVHPGRSAPHIHTNQPGTTGSSISIRPPDTAAGALD